MIIGVPQETFPGERRVALVPAGVAALRKAGFDVVIQSGAGSSAGFLDEAYTDKGARIEADRGALFQQADILLAVRALGANPSAGQPDLDQLRSGQVLIAMCEPLSEPEYLRQAAERGATVFSLEMIPRITRAQSMDVLSSSAMLAGYRAVLLAAIALPKMFPMMITAAGTLTPARVFIVGAGVAGLQAIATARRLGAVVEAYDVRPEVKEQVESLGAKFAELPLAAASGPNTGGYATAQDEDFYRRQREMMSRVVAGSDVVITTAAIPGRKAPLLVTGEMVAGMAPGSLLVDLAAERGGNCDLTEPGQTVVKHGVTIMGPVNVPADVPRHGSELFSKNITTFLQHLSSEGRLQINTEDQITVDTLLTRDGQIVSSRIRELLGLHPLAATESEPPASDS